MTQFDGKNMIRLQRRLLTYVLLLCILLVPVVWLLAPAKSGGRYNKREPRLSKTPSSVNRLNGEDKNDDLLQPLKALFKASDTTADGFLSINELTWAIHRAVEKHMQSAMRNNIKHFFRLDKINHNGQVEWDEWLTQFYQDNNVENSDYIPHRSVKEKLAAARAAWSEAARSNPDALNIDEFLSFTHPESSHSSLAQQAEEMFGRYDADSNGVITLNEFLQDPYIEFDDDEKSSRERIFKEDMDSDKNGHLDRREVVTYLDPKHVSQSKVEALRLIELADQNNDGFLDWNELQIYAEDFFDSKWISPQRAFHGDL